ncbi:hypothetical protein CYY_004664 [Polysphondylium violaceum]|uniref:Acetyl-CoA synthetase-like protein n=1 Tax=Polysphondylium violaceum TaxID=133409 RepID=A0A8J4PUZ4_9MYCE|nr:hypothetical protein CYY_004664 [Polysphondylium violaceum]
MILFLFNFLFYFTKQQNNNLVGLGFVSDPFNFDYDVKSSKDNPIKFWGEIASKYIHWEKKFDEIYNEQDQSWFNNGLFNICFNCLDVHLNNPDIMNKYALIHDNPSKGLEEKITYSELYERVCEFSTALKSIGITKGDRVLIYMPNINQTAIAMLACSRIGAIHNVVYGGYPSYQLSKRIDQYKPKLLISSNFGLYHGSEILSFYGLISKSLELSNHQIENIIIYKRKDLLIDLNEPLPKGSLDWDTLIRDSTKNLKSIDRSYTLVEPNHPHYVLYSSGSTGNPKPIVTSSISSIIMFSYQSGPCLGIKFAQHNILSFSDFAWGSGHQFKCYAVLINGLTTIVHEGDTLTPNAGVIWSLVEKYKINGLFLGAKIGMLQKEDPQLEFIKKYDISSLNMIWGGGEKVKESLINFITKTGKPLHEIYACTECGVVSTNAYGSKPGMTGAILPGYNFQILDEKGEPVQNGKSGELAIKLPLPPNYCTNLDQDHQLYVEKYLSRYPGYFTIGDIASLHHDGKYINILSRRDDVVSINGAKWSMEPIEEILSLHPSIAECSAVVIKQPLQLDKTLGFVVLKSGQEHDIDKIEKESISLVKERIGSYYCFKGVVVVNKLPKNRNGKIIRSILSSISNNQKFEIPPTIENENDVMEIQKDFKSYNLKQK